MLDLAISPCPNDTFLFGPWALGAIADPPRITYGDIEKLNQWALEGRFPLIKVSIATLPLLKEYQLLPVGAALGFHVGPKIIAKRSYALDDLPNLRLAIPGEHTTAHLLLQKLCPEPLEKHFCLFHQISDLLKKDVVDAGVIIHESRFTFESEGFIEVADLGELWHEEFDLPLPLGGLAIKRDYPFKSEIIEILQACYDYAYCHTDELMPYIKEHARIKEVILPHIYTYVNQETRALSALGWQAIERLTDGKITAICPVA